MSKKLLILTIFDLYLVLCFGGLGWLTYLGYKEYNLNWWYAFIVFVGYANLTSPITRFIGDKVFIPIIKGV